MNVAFDPSKCFPETDEEQTCVYETSYLAEVILREYVAFESDTRGSGNVQALGLNELTVRLSYLKADKKAISDARKSLWLDNKLHLRYTTKPERPNILNGSGYFYILE